MSGQRSSDELQREVETLQTRVDEVEEILRAIRAGEVDALLVATATGDQVFTLQGAERPYRAWVETMQEGAVTLAQDGLILHCNQRFAEILGLPPERVLGHQFRAFVEPAHQAEFEAVLASSVTQQGHAEIQLRAVGARAIPVAIAYSAFDFDGTPAVCLVTTDLTAQHQREQEVVLLQQLQLAVSEAPTVEAALHTVVRSFVDISRWDYGEAWTFSTEGEPFDWVSAYYGGPSGSQLAEYLQTDAYITRAVKLIEEARKRREMIFVADVQQAPDMAETSHLREAGVRGVAIVPVTRQAETAAVLAFFASEPVSQDQHFVRLTSTVASQLGTFIRRKQAEEALQRARQSLELRVKERTAELEAANAQLQREIVERIRAEEAEHRQRVLADALRDTAMAVNNTLDLSEVLNAILNHLGRVVPHDTADIMLIEDGHLRLAGSRGHTGHGTEVTAPQAPLALDQVPVFRQIAETYQPLVLDHLPEIPPRSPAPGVEAVQSYVGLAIRSQDELLGFLSLTSTESGGFTPDRIEALQIFAEEAGVAIRNAQLYAQAQAAAVIQERERLARDLHDAVSQTLFSTSLLAEALPRWWKTHPEQAEEQLVRLQQMTRGALAEMRTLLLELRPAALTETDLDLLLSQLATATQSRKQLDISVRARRGIALSPDVKLSFYRVAQEALNNIVKHARATHVTIELKRHEGAIELSIEDDGSGFDAAAMPGGTMGLHNMRERAVMIGASLAIASEPGRGTRVVVNWSPAAPNGAQARL